MGYGDVEIRTPIEKLFTIATMLIGVIVFTFASGSLASILQYADKKSSIANKKFQILNKIQKEYYLPLDLVTRIKKSL